MCAYLYEFMRVIGIHIVSINNEHLDSPDKLDDKIEFRVPSLSVRGHWRRDITSPTPVLQRPSRRRHLARSPNDQPRTTLAPGITTRLIKVLVSSIA